MISQDDIQRIHEACRIEEVVGEFVFLKKKGANFWGLCPFHNEKTPSFSVSPSKNIYKCFGCGAAGGSVNFVMQHENYTYPEALRFLAKKYNIEIIEKEISAEEKQTEDEKQLLFRLHELAQKFYSEYLHNSDEGKSVGLSYLKGRKFSDNAIEKFGLGYAPDGKNGFVAWAISQGYKHEDLKTAGLAVDSPTPLDKFRGRVIFPIYSIAGRVLGFGARMLKANDQGPKYLNSPETPIYHKSKVLFGLNLAKNAIQKHDNCYIVEGYTDVISLYQAEIQNVVASSGTSLTDDQIRLIKRHTSNVTVLFDGDPAGVKAAFRGIDMLLDAGMNVKVLLLPDNEDPDSFATKNRDQDIVTYFETHAQNFIKYKAEFLSSEAGNDPVRKATIIKDIVQSIARIQDGITRALFVRECSEIIRMDETLLAAEVSKILRKRFAEQGKTKAEPTQYNEPEFTHDNQIIESTNRFMYLENRIAGLLINYHNHTIPVMIIDDNQQEIEIQMPVTDFIMQTLLEDEYTMKDIMASQVFNFFRKAYEETLLPDPHSWILSLRNDKLIKYVINLMTSPFVLSPNWLKELNIKVLSIDNAPELLSKEVKYTVMHYKLLRLQEEFDTLDKVLENTKDVNEQNQIIESMKHIQAVMKEIGSRLGIIRLD